MSKVFVIDQDSRPLDPIHPARARQLLTLGLAAVYRKFPFTVILKESRPHATVNPLKLKIDPGAGTTGIALVNESTGEVVWAGELKHRGFQIRDALTSRRQLRRARRNRKTRYRKPRFLNRTRSEGWLPPSLTSRLENTLTWVQRLSRFCPVNAISVELVKFDTQLLQNANISDIAYQQGTLMGYEVREFLLERWQRQCVYCGIKDVPLEVEHIQPRSKGGSDRISNLTLACHACNQKKGNRSIADFLSKKPDLLKRILAQTKKSLADTAAVNATRWELFHRLKAIGLPVSTGTGGQTKFNRTLFGLSKTHWIDAACVGKTDTLVVNGIKPLQIASYGHGTRQMCGTDKFGFPKRHRSKIQIHFGFQTGDIVKAVVTSGKKIGIYVGRILGRASGSFDIVTSSVRVTGINHKYCQPLHRKDGYSYTV